MIPSSLGRNVCAVRCTPDRPFSLGRVCGFQHAGPNAHGDSSPRGLQGSERVRGREGLKIGGEAGAFDGRPGIPVPHGTTRVCLISAGQGYVIFPFPPVEPALGVPKLSMKINTRTRGLISRRDRVNGPRRARAVRAARVTADVRLRHWLEFQLVAEGDRP